MLHRLILKVIKFQLPPPKRLSTVVKNILGGHHPPMSNRVNSNRTGLFDMYKLGKGEISPSPVYLRC